MHSLLSTERRFRLLLTTCALGIASHVVAAILQPPGANLVRHVAFFLLAFSFYLVAVVSIVWMERGRISLSSRALAIALIWAVLLRLALISTAPSLSDDVFRYVWDGKVSNAGIDPYAYPPSAPELAGLRGPLWNGINHKAMPTPYPPLAEGLFALVYRFAPDSLTGMQGVAVLFDVGIVGLLLLLLPRMRMGRSRVLVYAWNPLVLVQFAHSGHFDSAMLLTMLGAVFLLSSGRRLLSGVSLGISVLVKLVPAMVGPLFLPAWGIMGTVAAGVTVAAGTLPFLGSPALTGVMSEASDARFNDSAGYVIVRLLSLVTPDPDSAARMLSAVVLVVASLYLAFNLWRHGGRWEDLSMAVYWLLGLFLLLNAVVEPWYFTWMLPFLCFALPGRGETHPWAAPSWGWLLLSGSVILTDLTYLPSIGTSAWIWVRALEYGPLYCLLAFWMWRRGARLLPPLVVRSHPTGESSKG